MNKSYVDKSNMSIYVDRQTAQELRTHCATYGLSLSGTIGILIKNFLEKHKNA